MDGEIVIEYHPHSGKGNCVLTPEEFKKSLINDSESALPPYNEPWLPFASREDFEFADVVNEARLNQKQINRLIQVIRRCQDGLGSLTLEKYQDLKGSLDGAAKLLTNVITH